MRRYRNYGYIKVEYRKHRVIYAVHYSIGLLVKSSSFASRHKRYSASLFAFLVDLRSFDRPFYADVMS